MEENVEENTSAPAPVENGQAEAISTLSTQTTADKKPRKKLTRVVGGLVILLVAILIIGWLVGPFLKSRLAPSQPELQPPEGTVELQENERLNAAGEVVVNLPDAELEAAKQASLALAEEACTACEGQLGRPMMFQVACFKGYIDPHYEGGRSVFGDEELEQLYRTTCDL